MDVHVATFGLYPWFEEHGIGLIHPDDVEAFRQMGPYGRVFRREGREGDYIVLRYGTGRYRVRPCLFRAVPAPACPIGTRVSFMKGAKLTEGSVCDIGWHSKNQEHMYFLIVDGKRLSKRYSEKELSRVKEGTDE
jgi:hypothetical protein